MIINGKLSNDNKWKTVLEDNKFKPDAFSPSTQQQQN